MNSRVRFAVACAVALAILGPLGWMWERSLLPSSYSAMDMGYMDYGGGPHSTLRTKHGHHKAMSVADLVEHSKRKADVVVDLTAQASTFTVDGHQLDGFTLNGETPGQEVSAKVGQLVEVRLHNQNVDDGVTLHWHGVDVPNAEDGVAGVTQNAVMPGKSHTYRFVARQPGTYWYHSHQMSHDQVLRGLLGPIVILPKGGVKQKVDLTALAHTYSGTRTLNGEAGDVRATAKAGDKVRIRIINTDNGTLAAWSSVPYRVVAVDGYDVHAPTPVSGKRIDVPAGGRADLEVTVPKKGAARVQVGAATAYIVGPRLSYPPTPKQPMRSLDLLSYGSGPIPKLKPNRTFDYSIGRRPGFLDGRPGVWWTINGHQFPNVPMFVVRKGDIVKFHIDNHSGDVHPMHLHGHHALLVARNGKRATGSPLWLDSIDVKAGETADLIFRANNPGIWMDHCHNLPHAQEGLIAHLMYEGVTTPYRIGGKSANEPE